MLNKVWKILGTIMLVWGIADLYLQLTTGKGTISTLRDKGYIKQKDIV